MKPFATALVSAAACLSAGAASAAADPAANGLEIRFCPAKTAHTYPLQDTAKVQSLLLQNLAVINRGPSETTLTSIQIDLLDQGAALDTRRFPASGLEAAAKSGTRLKASGMMEAFAFQYCGGALLDGATLSDDTVLGHGEALLVSRQMFAWRGARDQARVRVEAEAAGRLVSAEAVLPISNGFSRTVFRFPLQGRWFVAVAATPHGGHRWGLPEEFALDIVQLGAGTTTHRGQGQRFADYYDYGAPVLAAADGTVVLAHDGEAEDPAALRRAGESLDAYGERVGAIQQALLQRGAIAGNHVVIDHGAGEYSVYVHLKTGSVLVRPGQRLKAGQAIGRLGSSGNSTEPHLHFQVCDAADPLNCAGIPISFEGVELPFADGPRVVQAGDIVEAR